jgi:hypothetical protein
MSPQEQANAGEGVKIIGRWHDPAARTGVVDDGEATAVYRQMIADNNA